MTAKPKTRKAPAANGAGADPIFAAIAEHKALIKESNRLGKSCKTVRAKEEKKHGEWILAPKSGEWPGKATVSPLYDRWNRVEYAASRAAMRMARTKPTTRAGAAAMIEHIRRETAGASAIEDWVPPALKTVAVALTRMEAA
jgi:hypothetical protein